MAFSTKISFVPRDSGEMSISFDNVNYGITGFSTDVFKSVKNEFAFLNFKEFYSGAYYDFVAVLSFEEFIDFHKKYYKANPSHHLTEELEKFLYITASKIRYNWVLIVVYEWEIGLD